MLETPSTRSTDYNYVYEPYEDSFLLLDLLEQDLDFLQSRFSRPQVPIILEIGSGSGIVTAFIHKHILPRSLSFSSDINAHACYATAATWTENNCGNLPGLAVMRASLASSMRPRVIDLLVFNPPYVPEESMPPLPDVDNDEDTRWLDLALVGGKDGMEVTWQILNELDSVLSDNGIAYLLFCARNKPEHVKSVMMQKGWKVSMVGHRKAGWEVLSVWKFERLRSSQ